MFPYFLEKRLAIPSSPFFHLLVNVFFLLLVSVLFRRPLTFIVAVGGEELKWHQLKHNQLMSLQGPHFSPTVELKPIIKAQISGRMASIGISDVVTALVKSEKTHMKKCMMSVIIIIIIIIYKLQETMVFGGRQKLTSALKLRPRNLMLYTAKTS